MKIIRDNKEETGLQKAEKEIEKVTIKDAVFGEFCKLLNTIDNKDMSIKAVEERFGIWLKMQEAEMAKKTKAEILVDFEKFEEEILEDKKNNALIKNSYFHILNGNKYLEDKKNKEAIDEFTKAIELDEHFAANAYYNRGYARIAEYCGEKNMKVQQEYLEQIGLAIEDFKKAKRIIEENLEPMLHIIQKASNAEALSEQVQHKMTLFGVQKNAIESAIGTGLGSVDVEIKQLEDQLKLPNTEAKTTEAINKQIAYLKENKEARETGIIGKVKRNENGVKIELIANLIRFYTHSLCH